MSKSANVAAKIEEWAIACFNSRTHSNEIMNMQEYELQQCCSRRGLLCIGAVILYLQRETRAQIAVVAYKT